MEQDTLLTSTLARHGWYKFDHCRRYLNHLVRLRSEHPGRVVQMCITPDLWSLFLREAQRPPIPILCPHCKGNRGHICTFCYGEGSQTGATFAGGPVFKKSGACMGMIVIDGRAFGEKQAVYYPGSHRRLRPADDACESPG